MSNLKAAYDLTRTELLASSLMFLLCILAGVAHGTTNPEGMEDQLQQSGSFPQDHGSKMQAGSPLNSEGFFFI